MITRTVEATKMARLPCQNSRGKVVAALFVCNVESTNWPVRAALTAIEAVSRYHEFLQQKLHLDLGAVTIANRQQTSDWF